MQVIRQSIGFVALALVASVSASCSSGVYDDKSPKQLNEPLPPSAMEPNPLPVGRTPRGVPQGMGNEKAWTKTPGDDDPSDGIDEPGRDPVPGLPQPAPGD